MLGSIPTAILADGYTRRDTCLRISALVGCVAIPFLTYAFQQMQLAALLAGYAALGLFFGSFVPPMEALFIDSTPFGQRTRPLVVKNNVIVWSNDLGLRRWHHGLSRVWQPVGATTAESHHVYCTGYPGDSMWHSLLLQR